MDQRVKMNRLLATVTVAMCRISGETDTLTGFKGAPLPLNTHIQHPANHHDVLNDPLLMRR